MQELKFTKMVASGNDFVVIESHQVSLPAKQARKSPSRQSLAKNICDRKYGIGADGLLLLEKSNEADIRMRIFNADGSEAEMCGNGARCVAYWLSVRRSRAQGVGQTIETKAGIIHSQVQKEEVKIKLTDPMGLKLEFPLRINNRWLQVNFINTGVPHAVIFVQGLKKINVFEIGRGIRYHKSFAPWGTNVNFIEVLSQDTINIRTYERGVEDETLACGTGSVASALIFALKTRAPSKINVLTQSGEILRVYFDKRGSQFSQVWLGGRARFVAEGKFFV
jgi:diaminopimelate epimerase